MLEAAEDFNTVFQIVKETAYNYLGRRRAGLGLILVDLPPQILGMYGVGSNYIMLNKRVFTYAKIRLNKLEFNSLLYIVLLHEYLHSLGYLDEKLVRRIVKEIARQSFGEDHLITRLSDRPVDIDMLRESLNLNIDPEPDFIKEFDLDNTRYIG